MAPSQKVFFHEVVFVAFSFDAMLRGTHCAYFCFRVFPTSVCCRRRQIIVPRGCAVLFFSMLRVACANKKDLRSDESETRARAALFTLEEVVFLFRCALVVDTVCEWFFLRASFFRVCLHFCWASVSAMVSLSDSLLLLPECVVFLLGVQHKKK
jgi:hypothetical protein